MKRGISLIVLVITIIVMIILAATIIISISNNGIVEKSNEAVKETNEAQLKQLVTLAWSEARLKDTTEVKDDAYYLKEVMTYLKESGITDKDLEEYEIIATTQGASVISKMNEYGFYFDKLYLAEITEDGENIKIGYVLHEDGSAEYYEEINGTLFCVNAFSSGSAVYAKEQITLGTLVATVSNEGKSLTANNITATLETLEEQGVQYGYEYEVVIDETTWLVVVDKTNTLRLYEVVSDDEKNETATSVQISGEGHYITNTSGEVIAYVSYDGKSILTGVNSTEQIFTLTERKAIIHKGIIPEGAVYYVGVKGTSSDYTTATATYTAGDPFPEVMNTGDIYIYGDYEYRYNMGFALLGWGEHPDITGWGVMRRDGNKVEYEPIISQINSIPVTLMLYTYADCDNMIISPKIPDTVLSMLGAFNNCDSLTTAPLLPENLQIMISTFNSCPSLNTYAGSTEQVGSFLNYVIPSSVTTMYYTFSGCDSIKVSPDWSNLTSITNMGGVFDGCLSLDTVVAIPSGVEDLGYAFRDCTSLKVAPSLTNATKLKSLDNTFYGCTQLATFSTSIPSTVENMNYTFYQCTSLTTAPTIPSSVKKMDSTFGNCINLTGTVTINATPETYGGTFLGTVKSIKLAGTCPTSIKEIMAYGVEGNNITY